MRCGLDEIFGIVEHDLIVDMPAVRVRGKALNRVLAGAGRQTEGKTVTIFVTTP